jgi:hypothetical protein
MDRATNPSPRGDAIHVGLSSGTPNNSSSHGMAGSFEHRAGNAGERPATRTAELPAYGEGQDSATQSGDSGSRALGKPAPISGAQLAAGADLNSRSSPRAGVCAGGRSGRGAREARYLDTHLATSSHQVFCGDTATGVLMHRKALRKSELERLVDSLNKGGEEAEAKRLSCCGEWFNYGRCPEGGTRLEPNPCNSKFCVNCADRKSRLLQKRLVSRCRRAGKRYWFLTLTVPNVAVLSRAELDHLIQCFASLRRCQFWKRVTLRGTTWTGVTGGVYSVECVLSQRRGDWNLHMHALLEMPRNHPDSWLDDLKREWFRITGNSKNLHLEPVYGRSKRGKKTYRRVNLAALKELVKYVTKAASFSDSPERVCEFLRAFRDVRRVQCFGSFFGALKDEEREPGDDGPELPCSCGKSHYHNAFTWSSRPVHISETKAMPDGTRQLKWDFWVDPRDCIAESPPEFQLMRQEVERVKQHRLGFSGALPEVSEKYPSLFAA